MHVFRGHTDTVRHVLIVKPTIVDVETGDGVCQEQWPKRPLIVTASRDHTLGVWKFPKARDPTTYFTYNEEPKDLQVCSQLADE
jgi:F-box and WD-40 domain protein CDC4